MQDLESSELRLQGELNDAQYQLATIVHTRSDEIDTLKNKILEIDEKLANSEAHRLIEIRAPEDGVVTAILAHPGQIVGTGSPMLKIVPQHAADASRAAGPEQRHRLHPQGRPGAAALQRFSLSEIRRILGHRGERLAYAR